MLSRRDAIWGLALTVGAVSTGLAGKAFATSPAPDWTPTALTPDQARIVDVVSEIIIPATDTPGARAAGVPQFIDRALADYCDEAQARLLRSGLDQIDADARAAHGAPFAALTEARQIEQLTVYDKAATAAVRAGGAPHFFTVLKQLTNAGYFTSEPGATQALQYDPVPGAYRGCVPLSEIGRAWAT